MRIDKYTLQMIESFQDGVWLPRGWEWCMQASEEHDRGRQALYLFFFSNFYFFGCIWFVFTVYFIVFLVLIIAIVS